jgi:hypothetical protein
VGYWDFFSSPDAEEVIMANFDSFFTITFPDDASLWILYVASAGGLRMWIENGRVTLPASYLSEAVSLFSPLIDSMILILAPRRLQSRRRLCGPTEWLHPELIIKLPSRVILQMTA